MLIIAECIEISEDYVAFHVARIGDLEMLRIGKHTVDLLLYLL